MPLQDDHIRAVHSDPFDDLARELANGSVTRGKALKLMGAALVGGALASLGISEAAADPPGCKRNGKHCKRDTQCCSGICDGGTCRPSVGCGELGDPCTSDSECCNSICDGEFCRDCKPDGTPCNSDGECCNGTCGPGIACRSDI